MVKKPEMYIKKNISKVLKLKYLKFILYYKVLYIELKKILINLLLFSKILKNNKNVQFFKNFLKNKKNFLYFIYLYYFQILNNNKLKNLYIKSK
jgi:hypothetical protein